MEILNINSVSFDFSSNSLEQIPINDLFSVIEEKNKNFWQDFIFLVDPDLMDKIIPPELKSCVDEESLREIIGNYNESKDEKIDNNNQNDDTIKDDESFWGKIKETENPFNPDSSATGGLFYQVYWGVYIRSFKEKVVIKDEINLNLDKQISRNDITYNEKKYYEKVKDIIKELFNLKNPSPVIFICPERIFYFSDPKVSGITDTTRKKIFETIFIYISLRCIAYHYMRDHIISYWSKFITHSFASFLAKNQFDNEGEEIKIHILNGLHRKSVLEDRLAKIWEYLYKKNTKNELKIWLVKWEESQPAISDSHYSSIMKQLFELAGKNFFPDLNSNDFSYVYKHDSFDSFTSKYFNLLNDGSFFWSKIGKTMLEVWYRKPRMFNK